MQNDFLTDIAAALKNRKYFKDKHDVASWIGVDPSSTNTGVAFVLQVIENDRSENVYVVSSTSVKPVGDLERECAYNLFVKMRNLFTEIELLYKEQNKYNATTPTVVLEIPAILGRGKQTINRDLKHRDSITAVRLALSDACRSINGIYGEICLEHEGKERPMRPIEMHGQAGAVKAKDKKQAVKDWVMNTAIVLHEFRNLDESDAAGLALTAINKNEYR